MKSNTRYTPRRPVRRKAGPAMKRRSFFLASLLLTALLLAGCSQTANESGASAPASETALLTLDDVLTLSKKGNELTWSDFGQNYTEVGSGLYIRRYQVEQGYYLLIGGTSLEWEPMYIYLVRGSGEEDDAPRIDIRKDDVAAFLAE